MTKDRDCDNRKHKTDAQYRIKVITRGNCMICGKELTDGLFICKKCEDKAKSEKKTSE